MASATIPRRRAAHCPLYDIKPLTGISFEGFYTDRTWKHSAGEALVGFWWPTSEAVHQGRLAYRTVRYEPRSLSARDEITDAGHLLMHERLS